MRTLEYVADQKLTMFFRGDPFKVLVVRKVHKGYCECTDGSKWNTDGYSRPREHGYSISHVEPHTEQHREFFRRSKLLGTISRTSYEEWGKLSTEDLIKVSEMLLKGAK
jgi:hypothetical protein